MKSSDIEKDKIIGNIIDTNYDFQQIDKIINLSGVTFNNIQQILPSIKESTELQLVRDRFNAYDRYAIKVLVLCDKELKQIGWIPKDLAKILSPEMDAGIVWKASFYKMIGTEYENKGALINLYYVE